VLRFADLLGSSSRYAVGPGLTMDRRRPSDSRLPLSPILTRDRMSPPSNDVPQTPESKSSNSGLASVFKSITSSRHRTPVLGQTASSTTSLSPSTIHGGSIGRTGSRGGYGTGIGQALIPPSTAISEPEGFLTPNYIQQQIRQIQRDQPHSERIAGAEALRYSLGECAPNNVVEIWSSSKDLIDPANPTSARTAGFELLAACIRNSDQRPLERRQFFQTLSETCHPDDFHLQLSLMVDLTSRGRNLTSFETLIVPLLTEWLKTWFLASNAARKDKTSRSNGALGEETNLAQLFSFVIDIVRFNFKAFQERDVERLLEEVVSICGKTTVEIDIRNSIRVIDAIITYGFVPNEILLECIRVLCRTYATLKNLKDETWKAMMNLCKSHVAQTTLSGLLNLIRKPEPNGVNTNTIRGALYIIDKLLKSKTSEGLVTVSVPTLMESLRKALSADNARLELELLRVLKTLLGDPTLSKSVVEEDGTNMLRVLTQCAQRADKLLEMPTPISRDEQKEREIGHFLSQELNEVFAQLEVLFPRFEIIEKERIMTFFFSVHDRLSDSCADLLIGYYIDEHFCYPSNSNWLENSNRLIRKFLKSRSRQPSVRLQVLRAIQDVYETIRGVSDPEAVNELIWSVLDDLGSEKDAQVLEVLVNFAVEVIDDANIDLFDRIFDSLQQCLPSLDLTVSPTGSGSGGSRPASSTTHSSNVTALDNIATRATVHIFMRAFSVSAYRAARAFDTVLKISRSENCATDARLSAMKLLFRLRCDSNGAVIIVSALDSDGLAAALNRTPETNALTEIYEEPPPSRHSRADDNVSIRSSRSTSMGQPQSYVSRSTTRSASGWGGTARSSRQSTPMWLYPDENALPQDAPSSASRLLYAYEPTMTDQLEGDATEEPTQVLSFNLWLEAWISILQQGGDWEVYSHILIHMGSQLTNHRLFLKAAPQIKILRSVLCEQIKSNTFHDPPSSTGLRKADVAVCLYHTLTMIMSYFKLFGSNEQDDIVRTFMSGLGQWEKTGKRCIHGLTICCHELSHSISKSMNLILQKMQSLITQSHLAVHVLEFLAGLARMSKIYVNFREDDYRTVFGICFRYLQYAREQRLKGSGPSSQRTSYASGRQSGMSNNQNSTVESKQTPPNPDDLPQYVYALAYHVIIFWFMSLKISDRARHISWITKSLISIDANGRETMDEQSQVTIDMMQRVAFSDFDETVYNPHFASSADGEVRKKTWIDGLSIVTVETAAASGLSQIIKRQPSGTSHSIFRLERAPMPQHQIVSESDTMLSPGDESSRIAVLPSHIFLQLSSTSFRLPESMRPIPLPDDDVTQRAMSSFDRNSSVDGHKVGIIYIGEHQSTEQEILSNVMGSNDYTDFLDQLGILTKLKGARFNTQGLDRVNDTDGQFTYCWRDRVTELVFHITTMMPTDSIHDPHCNNKKSHTGNDFVNIIFNNSGQPFRFDTFPSDFNYVNIVITPESRVSFVATRTNLDAPQRETPFYKVQVMSKPGFPEISPAAETKIISGESLPAFVRLIALNASVFSLVWSNREGGENISSWRNRLRAIVRLRERLGPANTGTNTPTNSVIGSGGAASNLLGTRDSTLQRDSLSLRRSSAATFMTDSHSSHRSSMLSTATETDITANSDGDGVLDA
jgi:hypothetical protein